MKFWAYVDQNQALVMMEELENGINWNAKLEGRPKDDFYDFSDANNCFFSDEDAHGVPGSQVNPPVYMGQGVAEANT